MLTGVLPFSLPPTTLKPQSISFGNCSVWVKEKKKKKKKWTSSWEPANKVEFNINKLAGLIVHIHVATIPNIAVACNALSLCLTTDDVNETYSLIHTHCTFPQPLPLIPSPLLLPASCSSVLCRSFASQYHILFGQYLQLCPCDGPACSPSQTGRIVVPLFL